MINKNVISAPLTEESKPFMENNVLREDDDEVDDEDEDMDEDEEDDEDDDWNVDIKEGSLQVCTGTCEYLQYCNTSAP